MKIYLHVTLTLHTGKKQRVFRATVSEDITTVSFCNIGTEVFKELYIHLSTHETGRVAKLYLSSFLLMHGKEEGLIKFISPNSRLSEKVYEQLKKNLSEKTKFLLETPNPGSYPTEHTIPSFG